MFRTFVFPHILLVYWHIYISEKNTYLSGGHLAINRFGSLACRFRRSYLHLTNKIASNTFVFIILFILVPRSSISNDRHHQSAIAHRARHAMIIKQQWYSIYWLCIMHIRVYTKQQLGNKQIVSISYNKRFVNSLAISTRYVLYALLHRLHGLLDCILGTTNLKISNIL